MIRRLLNVATVLSLLVAVLLAIAGFMEVPGRQWWLGDPNQEWAMVLFNGTLEVLRFNGTTSTGQPLLSSLISTDMRTLAILFGVPPLAWGIALFRQARRSRRWGFPIEPIMRPSDAD